MQPKRDLQRVSRNPCGEGGQESHSDVLAMSGAEIIQAVTFSLILIVVMETIWGKK
jgi:hypothetical protein